MTTQPNNTAHPLDATDRFAHLGEFDLVRVTTDAIRCTATHSDEALGALLSHLNRLAELLKARQGHQAIDGFLSEVDDWDSQLDRYAALHTADLAVGCKPQPTRWPGWVAADANLSKRPLRPLELALVRLLARTSTARAALVATAMAGADSGELAIIRPDAPHVVDGLLAGEIDLPGGEHGESDGNDAPRGRPGPTRPYRRTVHLPAWAHTAITARLEATAGGPDALLLYSGSSQSPSKIESSLLMNLNATLKLAGLAGDRSVSPLSIRNGAARERYDETGSIEAVAAMLGYEDLNLTQRHIGKRPGLVKRIR